jgi:cytochrome d ubiquinol oxidase subunit II
MPLMVAVLVLIGAVSLWTPFLAPDIADRWFRIPNLLLVAPVPVLVALLALLLWRALKERLDRQPFLLALGLFVLSYAGLGISNYPYVVPRSVTIWQAAAPDSSLAFLLIGALVLLPLILAYTAYAYWVFRGKITSGEGYH